MHSYENANFRYSGPDGLQIEIDWPSNALYIATIRDAAWSDEVSKKYICTNKCIINKRYIPEHQNRLNIYDLQNYEFFTNLFSTEKIRKIR